MRLSFHLILARSVQILKGISKQARLNSEGNYSQLVVDSQQEMREIELTVTKCVPGLQKKTKEMLTVNRIKMFELNKI